MLYQEMYDRARKSNEMKCLTPMYMEWERTGQLVVGKFVSVVPVASSVSEGQYNQYLVDTDAGLVKFAMGTATDREIEPLLRREHIYVFTFKGKEKLSGGRSVNKFLVEEILTGEVIDIPEKPGKEYPSEGLEPKADGKK